MEAAVSSEKIKAFLDPGSGYGDGSGYSNRDLYDWHHRLTGSCEMGRNEFVASKGIDLDGESTIEEFVEMTKNSYGSSTIRKLPERYGES